MATDDQAAGRAERLTEIRESLRRAEAATSTLVDSLHAVAAELPATMEEDFTGSRGFITEQAGRIERGLLRELTARIERITPSIDAANR